jgi:hypothetical protein
MLITIFTHGPPSDTTTDVLYLLRKLQEVLQAKNTLIFTRNCYFTLSPDWKTATYNSGQHFYEFLFVDKPLFKTMRTWFIEIKSGLDGIAVGVAHPEVNDQKPWDYSSLGHNAYVMSYNSYTWSHSDPETNFNNGGFEFKTGEIIRMTYDAETQTLTFQCQQRKYVMSNVPSNTYPCVMMSNHGDCAAIFNENEVKWKSIETMNHLTSSLPNKCVMV